MSRAEFFSKFILQFYSAQVGMEALLLDAQKAWDAILQSQIVEYQAVRVAMAPVSEVAVAAGNVATPVAGDVK